MLAAGVRRCHNWRVLSTSAVTGHAPGQPAGTRGQRPLKVVLFSGGRGSGVLTRQLVANPAVALTIAINGYDDGASTGEVRRFLGDSLGPSDFRKNASRLAAELRTCGASLIDLLDRRLPAGASEAEARRAFGAINGAANDVADLSALAGRIDAPTRQSLADALNRFAGALAAAGGEFNFSDCSLGNLVFAGMFLACGRDFNRTVDAYTALVGLPPGLIENVTDGTNAWLVALDADGRLLASEEEIADAARPNRIRDLFLIDRPIGTEERAAIEQAASQSAALLDRRSVTVALNPRLAPKISDADLIIYAPGTQHSSLFPSYLTPGLSRRIAGNLHAIKLLITNIQADAEITGSNAVDIIERAVHYLKEKGRLQTPTPCLITHYVVNDPGTIDVEAPYVPLGPVESIEDPRLVRIANYEDGVSGRHDAARILTPFIESILARQEPRRVAILLHDAGSMNKLTQTLLEMVRGGLHQLPLDVTVFYESLEPLDPAFVASLAWTVRQVPAGGFVDAARAGGFDYVILFESSGMYRGDDVVGMATHLATGQFDAVWGSRRLSVRDIEESYRFRFRKNVVLGAISYVGSHLLSLAYLVLYGRYISDTLSAARAIRAGDALDSGIDLTHKRANQYLLSDLLRRKAEILEIPVRFLPISPEKVRRTSPLEGIQSLLAILWRRVAPPRRRAVAAEPAYRPDRRPSDAAGSSR
jgi:2-phospho-L-lactate transferase/gluconeogenesis factor (CofD/UPF0052 family)